MTQKRPIPPYHVNPDGKSCGQCVYRMMLEHFRPGEDWSFERMNEICDAVPGKGTWSFHPIIELVNMGLDVRVFEVFDVPKFLNTPVDYLRECLDEDTFRYTMEEADLDKGIEGARIYQSLMDKIDYHSRLFEPEDLRALLDEGFLASVWVNALQLNGKEGCEGHVILAYDYDEKGFYVHDCEGDNPGFQMASRYIPDDILMKVSRPTVDPLIAVRG